MGRFIGSFMDDEDLDRPDLNKCPDCECYFPQDTCPLCGKVCPEEMRAGNRKKAKKKKNSGRNGRSNTVQYIDWYHRWWFIILMLIIFPFIGILLLISSPNKKSVKLTIVAVALVYGILSSIGIGNIISSFNRATEKPVNESLSYEEYVTECDALSGEAYFRVADSYKGQYVKMMLTVKSSFTDYNGYYNKGKYPDYYICDYKVGEKTFEILVRDCNQGDSIKLNKGDVVTVYGECAGNVELNTMEMALIQGACINAAYINLMQ